MHLKSLLQHNIVLGIETSCDETALALYGDKGLIGDVVYSQAEDHQRYGGVVPELAAREHLGRIDYLFDTLLQKTQMQSKDISHIAYTKGPGLIGALLVGANYAQGLAAGLKCPLIGIHHLEAHIASPFINQAFPNQPFITLLLSGGHTQIILTERFGTYTILGETRDDAIGEAFDKTAKIMGLGYPGGPAIERLALNGTSPIDLPRPMRSKTNIDMSFSGLKTAVRNAYESGDATLEYQANVAAGLQAAIADVLIEKLNISIKQTGIDSVVVSGGVSANQYIRARLKESHAKQLIFPDLKYCTDNAAMVAYLGYLRKDDPPSSLDVKARWRLSE